MQNRSYSRSICMITLVIMTILSCTAFALEKADLELVFEDDFESGMDGWTLSDLSNWRVEQEEDSDNHVLSLFSASEIERKHLAPRSVAMVNGVTAGEFVALFDGISLSGWNAPDMTYWSVEDGAITAESTDENPCTTNQFLVWQGGEVADFELKAKFRLADNSGNSGIQFRSRIDANGMGIGYQADILPGGPWCGALADEYTGREPLMVPNGHKTVVDADGTRTCTPMGDPVSLRAPGEWNDYHILALGHRMVLTVNGRVSAEFIDNDAEEFDASGILALQLRSGPSMKVQFKDILLKRLP